MTKITKLGFHPLDIQWQKMKYTSTIQRHGRVDIYTRQLFQDKFQSENRKFGQEVHMNQDLKVLLIDARHTQT